MSTDTRDNTISAVINRCIAILILDVYTTREALTYLDCGDLSPLWSVAQALSLTSREESGSAAKESGDKSPQSKCDTLQRVNYIVQKLAAAIVSQPDAITRNKFACPDSRWPALIAAEL